MLDGEVFDDLPERAPFEAGRPKRSDEVPDLFERALEQADGFLGALRRSRVAGEGAFEHLELGESRKNVLHRPVVHVEHDALQLPLARREEAPRGGARVVDR